MSLPDRSLLDRTLVMILAGGEGSRLFPLTRDRAKPGVPFGGIYRIIDFTLSNCLNSGFRNINILTQYKSFSLDRHLRDTWLFLNRPELKEGINIIPPQLRVNRHWYQGTADAIYQNIYILELLKPDRVLILSGDHIYKMNYASMIETHVQSGADLTIGGIRIPSAEAHHFGIMVVDTENKVERFVEKPQKDPPLLPGQTDQCLASMGIYVFNTRALVRELTRDARNDASAHDFGKNIIPGMLADSRLAAHMFKSVDGESDPYWRDVGTLDAYYQANLDLLDATSSIDIFDQDWPVRTFRDQWAPSRVLNGGKKGELQSTIIDSIVPTGCLVQGAEVERCVLGPYVRILDGSTVEASVIMEDAVIGAGSRIRNAIMDKHVRLKPGTVIGQDPKEDRKHFQMSDDGIVIVPKSYTNDR